MSFTLTINEAKEQVKKTAMAYLKKDENGNYIISTDKQRPVFLLGAPGIGKTAVMSQVAEELNINLVAYSMTHHTRQSAIGLPAIETKNFNGKEYKISQYTMSEIIASVYESIENSGIKEGILFLDEINCVSETLSPALLQFLQFKIFGKHKIPEGWVIMTAGNPSEYNDSAKEYDLAISDRLKIIEVRPDYNCWKEYAFKKQIIPEIIAFLDRRPQDFYIIETDIDSKKYITPRGWEDLSSIIKIYKSMNLEVDKSLICQYLHHEETADEFFIYYKNFSYVSKVLSCETVGEMENILNASDFNSAYAMIIAVIDKMTEGCKKSNNLLSLGESLQAFTKELFVRNKTSGNSLSADLEEMKKDLAAKIELEKNKTNENRDRVILSQNVLKLVTEYPADRENLLSKYNEQVENISNEAETIDKSVVNYCNMIFDALENLNQSEIYLSIFMRNITINKLLFNFVSENNIHAYNKHSNLLKLTEMQNNL